MANLVPSNRIAFNMRQAEKPSLRSRAAALFEKAISPFARRALSEEQFARIVKLLRGSQVSSPSTDKMANQWRHFGMTNDTQALYALYTEIREYYATEVLTAAACRRLTRGAVMNGFDHQFEPRVQTPEARAQAKWAQWATEQVRETLNGDFGLSGYDYNIEEDQPVTIADASEMLGRYGNLPVQLGYDAQNFPRAVRPFPPFAWTKNNDQLFRWIDRECAYIQHDADTWQIVDKFAAREIVWCMADREPWERYAVPRILNARQNIRGLTQLFENLPDARIHATPEKFYRSQEPLDDNEFTRLFNSLAKNRKKRGEKTGIFDHERILQGVDEAGVISISTDFFNQMGDADAYAERIALGYDLPIGALLGQKEANRATLEFIQRAESMAQRGWFSILARTLIFPIFRRVIQEAGLNISLLRCEVTANESRTPEEQAALGTAAKQYKEDGVISKEDYQAVACAHLGLKQDQVKKKIEEEKAAATLEPVKPSVSAPMNGKPSALPGSNINRQIQPADITSNLAN